MNRIQARFWSRVGRSALFAAIALAGALPVRALEGFQLVAEQPLNCKKPVCITSLGDAGLVVYDAGGRDLHFFDSELNHLGQASAGAQGIGTVTALAFDHGRREILALDAKRRRVCVLDMQGTLSETIDLAISGPFRVAEPCALAVDTNGLIYVADAGYGDIKAFGRQGIFLTAMSMGVDGEGKAVPLQPAGASLLGDGSIAVLDAPRRLVQTFARDGTPAGTVNLEGRFRRLSGLIATRDGCFISTDDGDQRVIKWNPDGRLVALFGAKGQRRGEFLGLAGVAGDDRGRIITLDSRQRKIQVFALEGVSPALAGRTAPPDYRVLLTRSEAVSAQLLAILPEGPAFFDARSREVRLQSGGTNRVFRHPDMKAAAAACSCDGRLFVFDRGTHTVFAFSLATGEFLLQFGGGGRRTGALDDVIRMLPGPAGTLYLADEDYRRVSVFSRDGIFCTSFGEAGEGDEEAIAELTDMAWRGNELAVLDGKLRLIRTYDSEGRFLRNLQPALPDKRTRLASIAADPQGFFLLLDSGRSRVLVVNEDGRRTWEFGSQGNRPQDWIAPDRLVSGKDGGLFVFDRGGRPRLLAYELRTPGPIGQAAAAIAAGSSEEAARCLAPFVDGLASGVIPSSYDGIRAIALVLRADIVFRGFLNASQREVAQAGLDRWLKENPANHDERLALAESLLAKGRASNAIAVLQAWPGQAPDARREALLDRCRKAVESAGEAKPVLNIVGCEIPPIFAALSRNYFEHPIIKLTLSNTGGRPVPEGTVTFFAKAVMDDPTETPTPAIPPFSTRTVMCRATFNRNVLTYVETARLSASIEATAGQPPNHLKASSTVGFELQGRNNMDWKQEAMIACFITPKDPDVQVFMRRAMNTAGEQTIQADLDPHLYTAITLFDAMQSVNMYYAPDPKQPFNYGRLSSEGVIDYVQYPCETLLRLSGDCDDLSVLYASLLEGSGIPTLLVTSPGHIFVAFELKNGGQALDALGIKPEMLVEYEGRAFVPVETTLLGSPFVAAWRMAANTVGRHGAEKKIGFIDIEKSWEHYKTVSLPPQERQIPVPTRNVLGALLRLELDAMNLKQVETRLAVYKRWLEREPRNLKLLILLARSYGEVGVFDLAQEYADRAREVSPDSYAVFQVLGNLSFMQNQYSAAADWFLKADALDHTAAIQVNLALAYLKDGKLVPARKAYAEAKKLDPELVNGYPELTQLLD